MTRGSTNRRRHGRRLLAGLLLIPVALAPRAAGQEAVPASLSRPDPALSVDDLRRIHAELEGLTGEPFREAVRLWLGQEPEATRSALILRAGAPVPPTLATARAQRRAVMRGEALEQLQAGFEVPGVLDDWPSVLAQTIESAHPDLRCASMRVAAELEYTGFSRTLARQLGDPDAGVRHAARLALHDLLGVWFGSPEEYAAFDDEVPGSPYVRHLAQRLRMNELRVQALLVDLMESAPARAVEYLDPPDPDPFVRGMVAEHLPTAVGAGDVEAARAIELLLGQLEREADATAFHREVGVLVDLLQGRDLDDPSVVRARELLDLRGSGRLVGPALAGWRRLPWDSGPVTAALALARATAWIDLLAGGDGRIVDPDELAAGIEDWRRIAEDVPPGAGAERLRDMRTRLVSILQDASTPETVSRAAAGALVAVMAGADLEQVFTLLRDPLPTEVRLTLFGALRETLRAVTSSEEFDTVARRLVPQLLALVETPDPRLQVAALEFLLTEDAGPFLRMGVDDGTLTADVALDLLGGDDAGVQSAVLALVRRVGQAGDVDRVLTARPSLRLPTVERVRELRSTLAVLAGDDRQQAMRAARWLVVGGAGESSEEAAELRTARLDAALRLACGPFAADATPIPAEDRVDLLGWARELIQAIGPAAVDETVRGRVLLEHLPAAPADQADRNAFLRALLLSAQPTEGLDPKEVQDAFDVALEVATRPVSERPSDAPSPARVQRDRARYLERAGLGDLARPVWRELAAALDGAAPEAAGLDPSAGELQPRDLRQAARRLNSAPLTGVEPDASDAALAAALLERVVLDPAWLDAGAEQRLADLEAWVLAAGGAGTLAALEGVESALVDLPPERAEDAYALNDATETDAVWRGLDGVRSDHLRLLQLREDLAAYRADLEGPVEAPDKGPAEGEGDEVSPDGEPEDADPDGSDPDGTEPEGAGGGDPGDGGGP